jgi:hypothetical protein
MLETSGQRAEAAMVGRACWQEGTKGPRAAAVGRAAVPARVTWSMAGRPHLLGGVAWCAV